MVDTWGHKIARRLFPQLGICEKCGDEATDRHHIDGDPWNNDRENIAFLCRYHHMQEDGRSEAQARRVTERNRIYNTDPDHQRKAAKVRGATGKRGPDGRFV
jgi:hypothetical protein